MLPKMKAGMNYRVTLIIYLLICFAFPGIFASQQGFRNLQPADGLDGSEINSIVQDQDGIIWMGTETGVVSFDGFDFSYYRPEPGNPFSLPERKITSLFVDSGNTLWIATEKYLCRYIKATDSFVTYRFKNRPEQEVKITALVQFMGNLIVQVRDGFYLIPLEEKDITTYPAERIDVFRSGRPVSHYFDLISASDDELYIVSANAKQGYSVLFKAAIQTEGDRLQFNIQSLAELEHTKINHIEHSGTRNMLYLATDKGVYFYSLQENRLLKEPVFEGTDIQILKYTSNNKLFGAGRTPELFYLDLNTGENGSFSHSPYHTGTLINNKILCLHEDFSGNLWAGHQGQGVSIMNLYGKEFKTFSHDPLDKNSLSSNTVTAIGGNSEIVFIGLRGGGMDYIDKKRHEDEPAQFRKIKLKLNNNLVSFSESVWDIRQMSESGFWVASDIGLLKLHREAGTWILEPFSDNILLNRPIRKVLEDDKGNLWCAITDQGLVLLPAPRKNPEKKAYLYQADLSDTESLSDNSIVSMAIDSKGRFWLGTMNGLNLLKTNYYDIEITGNTRPELKFERFIAVSKTGNLLNNNEINCIFENSDGAIWFGTRGGGINVLDPESGIFSHITTENGLPGNDVTGILPDEMGNLWISTKKGLTVYRQNINDPAFIYYSREDGLQGDRFIANSFYKSPAGEMFFGGELGFTRFFPQNINPNEIEPKLVFTSLNFGNEAAGIGELIMGRRILDRHINETEKIILPHNHKTFSIGVAALHYQYPYGNKIKYMLEGYDSDWRIIPAFYRNIYYANLPPGKYKLEVKAINANNISSANSRFLSIDVLKPWYLTWHAILTLGVLFVIITGGIVYIIFSRQKMIYNRKMDKLNLENTESKMALLTDIAHGIKTPLSLVIAPIEDLIQSCRNVKPEWESQLLLIQRNANYVTKIVNQIIDFGKIPEGKLKPVIQQTDIAKLIRNVVTNFKSFEKSRSVKIITDIPYESLMISIDPAKIEEILYNIISNAFKHTPENRRIMISLQVIEEKASPKGITDSQVKISVLNEGTPIKEQYSEKIFERFYKIDDRVEGTGIGLSFSRSLVEMHDGVIEVEPVAGKGTAFHIRLPLTVHREKAGLPAGEQPVEDISVCTETQITPVTEDKSHKSDTEEHKIKLVLAEDNSELRSFLKKVLSKNYLCYEASNGADAFHLVNEIVPDIVISDVIMPEMDGYEFCRKIKDSNKTCHIPVILLTAMNSHDNIVSGYETGADAYISKPFDLNILSSQITRLIRNRELIRKKYLDQNFMVEISSSSSKDDEFLMSFTEILEKNLSDPHFNVKNMAENLNVSSTQLYRKIKALTGHSPVEFIKILKLRKSYELLLERKNSVKEVCYRAGFNNISYFIKCFRSHFGITPAQLKNSGSGNHEPVKQQDFFKSKH